MAPGSRLQELTAKYMQNPRRYFVPLANEYRKTNDLDRAIALCREHLPSQPGHMSGHIVLGRAYFEKGDVEAAREIFLTSVALDDENLIALRHLGDIARSRNEITAARQWYARVLDADPQNEEIERLLRTLPGADVDVPVAPIEPELAVPVELELAAIVPLPVDDPTPPGLRAIVEAGEGTGALPPDPRAGREGATSALGTLDLATFGDEPGDPAASVDSILVDDGVGFAFDDIDELVDPATTTAAGSLPSVDEADFSAGIDTPSLGAGAIPATESDPLLSRPAFGALASFASWRSAQERETPSQPQAAQAPTPAAGVPPVQPTAAESGMFWDSATADATATAPEFVTETMAALYAQQGFIQQALDVYRALAAKAPRDLSLAAKVAEMELALDRTSGDAALEADADKALQFDDLDDPVNAPADEQSILERMYDVSPPPAGVDALDSAFGGGWSADADRDGADDDWFAEDAGLDLPADAGGGVDGIFGLSTDGFSQPVMPSSPRESAFGAGAAASGASVATLESVFGTPAIAAADEAAAEMLLGLAGQMVGRLPKEAPTLPVPDILELPNAVPGDEISGASPAPLLSFDRFFSGSGAPPRARIDTPVARATPIRPAPPAISPPSLSPTFGGLPVIPPPSVASPDAWATFDQFVPPASVPPRATPAEMVAPSSPTPASPVPIPAPTPIASTPVIVPPVVPAAPVLPTEALAETGIVPAPEADEAPRSAPSEFHRWLEGLS